MIRRSRIQTVRAAAILVWSAATVMSICQYDAYAEPAPNPAQPAMAAAAEDGFWTESVEASVKSAKHKRNELESNRLHIVLTARKYLGTPYLFGAKYGQTNTFDCSSFAKTVFAEHGMELPRVSRDQAKHGDYVERSDLTVGDLVFFATDETQDEIGHVGIYVGGGRMIHTYGDGGVKYSRIDAGYWDERYVTARRMVK